MTLSIKSMSWFVLGGPFFGVVLLCWLIICVTKNPDPMILFSRGLFDTLGFFAK